MRGHWESTTRKLNKHYQSSRKGQGGVIPPVDPFRLTFGEFYAGGPTYLPMYSIPEAGDIPVYPSGHGETYSFMYGAANSISGFMGMGNFADCFHLEGLRNLDHNIFVVLISKDNYEQYSDPSSSHYDRYLKAQELYADGTAARVLTDALSGNSIWARYRERYVKFNYPERFYSPHYVKEMLYGHFVHDREFPYDTKFELSAKSCKAGCFPNVNTTIHQLQSVTLAQYNSNNSRILNRSYSIGYSDIVNIYDKELNGESYVEINITAPDKTFYINNERTQGYRTDCRKARIYCFIHDNAYYVEQIAHIYDSNGDEITDIVVNLEYFTYPVPLYPYFLNPAFVQPQGTYQTYPYPLGRSTALSDGTFNRVAFAAEYNEGPTAYDYIEAPEPGSLFGKQLTFNQPTATSCSMMLHFLSETEFWNKHNEWCNAHGGTPYVPPVVTP